MTLVIRHNEKLWVISIYSISKYFDGETNIMLLCGSFYCIYSTYILNHVFISQILYNTPTVVLPVISNCPFVIWSEILFIFRFLEIYNSRNI